MSMSRLLTAIYHFRSCESGKPLTVTKTVILKGYMLVYKHIVDVFKKTFPISI